MVVVDTAPETEQRRIERQRQMPTGRKMELVGEMNRTVRTLALAGLRQRFPADSRTQRRRRPADLLLGPEVAARVCGPIREES